MSTDQHGNSGGFAQTPILVIAPKAARRPSPPENDGPTSNKKQRPEAPAPAWAILPPLPPTMGNDPTRLARRPQEPPVPREIAVPHNAASRSASGSSFPSPRPAFASLLRPQAQPFVPARIQTKIPAPAAAPVIARYMSSSHAWQFERDAYTARDDDLPTFDELCSSRYERREIHGTAMVRYLDAGIWSGWVPEALVLDGGF